MIGLNELNTKYNLKIAKSFFAKNMKEALNFAKKIGFPVTLKIESSDIMHKSDIGGVKLNINSYSELEREYINLIDSLKNKKSDVFIKGVIVQEMISSGWELILGYENNPIFGPLIMLGMGGIYTEVFKDVVFRLLPITKKDAVAMLDNLKFSEIIFSNLRNMGIVSKNMLLELILKVANVALDLKEEVKSFDLNPIIVWGEEYRIVDFNYIKFNKNDNYYANKKQIPNINYMSNFFNASSVALVGASELKNKVGGLALDSLAKHGYKGKVYPINPNHESLMGIKCYPTILDVPGKIDLVVITTPLKIIPEILYQCKKKNIHNVIIISAGGKEIGRVDIENKIREIALNFDIRIIGCNCIGIFDGYTRLDTIFIPYKNMTRPNKGSISLISQSGTVELAFLELLKKDGISKFISYGNGIDVDEGDLITFLMDDSSTDVISAYIEGLKNGRKFFEAAKKTAVKKPIVVYKAGRTPQASKAVLSHTGVLTGTNNLINGLMQQANIVQVDNIRSLVSASKALSRYKRIKGNKVLIITNGAGAAIQAIDRIVKQDKLKLSKLSEKTAIKLKKIFPEYVIIGNPIDLTGTATNEQYDKVINAGIKDKNVDLIMCWFVFQCKPITKEISSVLSKYSNLKPIICGAIESNYAYRISEMIEKRKIPIFYSVEEWVSAAEAVVNV